LICSAICQNWLTQIRELLGDIGATMKIANCWTPTKKRKQDLIIMYKVNQMTIASATVQGYNNWRL
jgi:hypothetical protein